MLIRSASWLSQAPNWAWQMSRLSWTGSPTSLTWTPQPLMLPRPLLKTMNPEWEAGFIYCQAPPIYTALPAPATSPPFLSLALSLALVQRGDFFPFNPSTDTDLKLHVGQMMLCLSPHTRAHVKRRQTDWMRADVVMKDTRSVMDTKRERDLGCRAKSEVESKGGDLCLYVCKLVFLDFWL